MFVKDIFVKISLLQLHADQVHTLSHQLYIIQGRYQNVMIIFSVHFFTLYKAEIDFREVWDHFCKAIFTLKSDKIVSPLEHYKVHKSPKKLYLFGTLLTWTGTRMSYSYFLLISLYHVKPKLILEKFETIFVMQFLPWNPATLNPF